MKIYEDENSLYPYFSGNSNPELSSNRHPSSYSEKSDLRVFSYLALKGIGEKTA